MVDSSPVGSLDHKTGQELDTFHPGKAWDRLLEAAQKKVSTETFQLSSLAKLSLDRTQTKKHLPNIVRRIDLIDVSLRASLRGLVSGESPWPLFIHGPAGTGKTCAALCLLDYGGGDYYTAASLCETVIQSQAGRLSWSNEGRSGTTWPESFWRLLAGVPLLVIDELGCRDRVSDFHYETVKRAIDERSYKPLVILSNHDLDTIERLYDDRLASRCAAGSVVKLVSKDRRLEPKK